MKTCAIFVFCCGFLFGPASASWGFFQWLSQGFNHWFDPNLQSGGNLLGYVTAINRNGSLEIPDGNRTLASFIANSTEKTLELLPSPDPWEGYFTYLYQHDTKFCLTLLVCQASATPWNFKDYGPRVAKFFATYTPSATNQAAWWYKRAALLGRQTKSLESCRINFPSCSMNAEQLIKLLDDTKF